jgi:D-lactate dehydrogenase
MKVLFYSAKDVEIPFLKSAMPKSIEPVFIRAGLNYESVLKAKGFEAISIFTSDDASASVIERLNETGVRYIGVRASGYDNVDIRAANENGIRVANVPDYSPYAVAEHAVALMLALNRKIIRANEQVHKQNFAVDQLVGFDLNKKTVGIIGTGRIGSVVAKILHGFGCSVMAYDVNRNQELEHRYTVFYTGLHSLCSLSDIITIHLPLNDQTHYLIDKKIINEMKRGVMLINTSRGAILNTRDVIHALSDGHIGYVGLDVYEFEKGLFFNDRSGDALRDPLLETLLSYSNVLITPHQAFATREALERIAATTFYNLIAWITGEKIANEITYSEVTQFSKNRETHTQIL